MCEAVAYDITCALDALAGVAYNTAVSFSKQARQICDEIYLKLSRLKEIPKYKSQYEVHHIVAKKATNAWRAKQILNNVDIGINSSANLVSLKTWLHRRIHTNLYYGWANSIVISAYQSAGKNYAKQRANVLGALNTIRTYLLSINATIPF